VTTAWSVFEPGSWAVAPFPPLAQAEARNENARTGTAARTIRLIATENPSGGRFYFERPGLPFTV